MSTGTAIPSPWWRRRAALADGLGLLAIGLVLLDDFRPGLLSLPTIMAGGDMPCHYPSFAFLKDYLLPRGRLHGWYAGAYLGHPLLLYYFPLPFLVMAALATVVSAPVALGVFLLPPLTYLAFRAMRLPFPAPLMGATASLVFLYTEENPIWGGTIASTTTGEFSYAYGIALAVVFLGWAWRRHEDGRSPLPAAVLLGLTALAHGYAVLWAGLSAGFFLYRSPRPWRTLGWLATLGLVAFGVAAFFLLPLLGAWGWTTPYNDAWITTTLRNVFPPLLWPLMALGALAVLFTLTWGRRVGAVDQRLLFLAHSSLVGACLALAGPALGIIDVRFLPFAQLGLCLAGAAGAGLALSILAAPELAALGLLAGAVVYADTASKVIRPWLDWDYTGLEAREQWAPFRRLNEQLRGTVGDPRVAVEYGEAHGAAGSIRVYETVPFFSGRSTLEGVYNQASLLTHPVYFLASELGATSPNPFRNIEYSRFDLDSALRHLRLFQVDRVVSVSSQLTEALGARSDARELAHVPPYRVFRIADPGGYVEPLAFAPVASSPRRWRQKAYLWFTRKPLSPAHLVFSDDPRFTVRQTDEFLAPPAVPLPGKVQVRSVVGPESVDIETDTPGHPLLVKISYHPGWRAEGADGPFLVSPALMMVIPRQPHVRLVYGRTRADWAGYALTLGTVALLALSARRAPRVVDPPAGGGPRWGWAVPVGVLVLLAISRYLVPTGPDRRLSRRLDDLASQAYAAGRWADAAEYARAALPGAEAPARAAALTLRGEALLRAGDPRLATEVFDEVTRGAAGKAYLPQALSGLARARDQLGDVRGAEEARARLRKEFPGTPWATDPPAASPAGRD